MSIARTDWQNWILYNLALLSRRFGKNGVVLNGKTWRSILIFNYALPSSWKEQATRLLIILPQKEQIFYDAPERFYIEQGLKASNGDIPTHYYEEKGFNDLSHCGLARFSFHLKSGWQPSREVTCGTTLEHVLAGLHIGLDMAAREVME